MIVNKHSSSHEGLEQKFDQAHRNGFSLIELIIAIAIFTIMVLGFFSVMANNYQLSRMSREKTATINILRQVASSCKAYVSTSAELDSFFNRYGTAGKGYDGITGKPDTISVTDMSRLGIQNVKLHASTGGINSPVLIKCYNKDRASNTTNPEAAGYSPISTDLNGNDADDGNITSGFKILPVRLSLEWRGVHAPSDTTKYQTNFIYIVLGEDKKP